MFCTHLVHNSVYIFIYYYYYLFIFNLIVMCKVITVSTENLYFEKLKYSVFEYVKFKLNTAYKLTVSKSFFINNSSVQFFKMNVCVCVRERERKRERERESE